MSIVVPGSNRSRAKELGHWVVYYMWLRLPDYAYSFARAAGHHALLAQQGVEDA